MGANQVDRAFTLELSTILVMATDLIHSGKYLDKSKLGASRDENVYVGLKVGASPHCQDGNFHLRSRTSCCMLIVSSASKLVQNRACQCGHRPFPGWNPQTQSAQCWHHPSWHSASKLQTWWATWKGVIFFSRLKVSSLVHWLAFVLIIPLLLHRVLGVIREAKRAITDDNHQEQ